MTNESWSLANLRFWENLEKKLCRKEYLDSVLFCKGNEDEKWKEQSHEEDDSAAASYTPMNSLELTTTNLSFQALTVWCWSFLNPDTKFQISNCYKWKNNKQFAAIGICWCYKTRETYVVEIPKSVFCKTYVHSGKVCDCRSTIKTNQTSKLVHHCQPQSPLQATRVWSELQTGLLLYTRFF